MHSLSIRQHNKFLYFLCAVFAIHMAFMLVQIKDKISFDVMPKPADDAIKVTFMPQEQPMQGTATFQPKKQIVQSEDTANREKKADAFLSDKTRSFDRETLAANVNKFQKAAKGTVTEPQVAQKPTDSKSKVEKTAKPIKDLKLSDIGMMAADPVQQEATRAPASVAKQGLENGDANEVGMSATNDYVQEVRLGDFTHLNTVEYKHYGFFHRIRQKLEQFWGNSIAEKSRQIFKAGRTIASQDYVTSLQVTLNAKGEIVGVKIMGASGVKELDDAAVESFNKAGPFPNPPKDLLVNGKATIEWGFVVKS
jgi:protein TonB